MFGSLEAFLVVLTGENDGLNTKVEGDPNDKLDLSYSILEINRCGADGDDSLADHEHIKEDDRNNESNRRN